MSSIERGLASGLEILDAFQTQRTPYARWRAEICHGLSEAAAWKRWQRMFADMDAAGVSFERGGVDTVVCDDCGGDVDRYDCSACDGGIIRLGEAWVRIVDPATVIRGGADLDDLSPYAIERVCPPYLACERVMRSVRGTLDVTRSAMVELQGAMPKGARPLVWQKAPHDDMRDTFVPELIRISERLEALLGWSREMMAQEKAHTP